MEAARTKAPNGHKQQPDKTKLINQGNVMNSSVSTDRITAPTLPRPALALSLVTAAVMLIAAVSTARPPGPNPNPSILPPNSTPYGHSYGEWAARWWQWALSIPADRNPLADTSGEFCDEGQSGPVWYLAGTFGNSADRECTVPAGKAIFVPVFNWIFGSGVFDCDPTVPGVPCDVDTLRAKAAANTEAAEDLDVIIDGVPVQNVRAYRASSPEPFSITYPENSVVGVPSGTYFPQVADGYWLMLAPLSKGQHTIQLHVSAPDTDFGLIEFVVVTHLTVD
jgi:hypothetical protein